MATMEAAMPMNVTVRRLRDSQPLLAVPMTSWRAASWLMNQMSGTASKINLSGRLSGKGRSRELVWRL
jgi:hypothetical protein